VNLIDAIKSGKRFRRSSWHALRDWVRPISNMCLSYHCDILADDWEVEEVSCYVGSAMITREQFDKAWSKLWPYDPYGDGLNSINCYTKLERDALAKELGL